MKNGFVLHCVLYIEAIVFVFLLTLFSSTKRYLINYQYT